MFQKDHAIVVETGRSKPVWAVAFHPIGTHFFSGDDDGIQRWRLEDGQEVGHKTGMALNAIAASRDHKWVVCGTFEGASVWDAEIQKKVVDVEASDSVYAVDISSDSTMFATGTGLGRRASIWHIMGGERLVGPLEHDSTVTGIKFSPNSEHIATSCLRGPISVFDSRNGNQVLNIETVTPSLYGSTLLAWSTNGRQILAATDDRKVRSFDVSTGSQLAESKTLNPNEVMPIGLVIACDGKFIAAYASRSILFLDTSTLSQVGPVINDTQDLNSVALSLDSSYLATGRSDGKITVRNLSNILPDLFQVSTSVLS